MDRSISSCRPVIFLSAFILLYILSHSQVITSTVSTATTPLPSPSPSHSYTVLPSSTVDVNTAASTVALSPSPSPLMPVFESNVITYGNNTCEPYVSGGPCQSYLEVFPSVVTNWTKSNQLVARYANDRIIQTLDQFMATDECKALATPLLCRYSFPTCDPAFKIPTYQPVCQRDCLVAQHFLCREPWLKMEELIDILQLSVIDLPTCVPLRNPNAGDAPMCVGTVSIYQGEIALPLQTGPDCYSGHGRGYNGTVNVTRGGIPCQRWDLSYPHQHLLHYEQYPELEGGHNYCRNPAEKGERPWCFTTNQTIRWDYCDIPECPGPTCENYQGEGVCFARGMIGYDKVFIDKYRRVPVGPDPFNPISYRVPTQADYEHAVVSVLSGTIGDSTSGECEQLFRDLLCATNFPSCDLTKTTPTPIRPCRQFCERVHEACGEEFDSLQSFARVTRYDPAEVAFNCSTFPDTEAGDLPECFMPIIRQQGEGGNTTCYNTADKGFLYLGTVSVTASGKQCQHWGSQSPHYHTLTPSARIYLSRHNYCRNPESRGDRPWCYTTDPSTRWEYCNIPTCTQPGSVPLETIIAIAVAAPLAVALGIFVLVIIICGAWCCCSRKKSSFVLTETSSQRYVKNALLADGKEMNGLQSPLYARNPLPSGETQLEYDGAKLPTIPRETIVYTRDLGQGHFGVVVQAEAESIGPEKKPQTVAVKILKIGSSMQVKKEFFREAALMNALDHPNILKLYGVCIEQEPLCLVFEFMEEGDLNNFLRNNTPKPLSPGITNEQLVEFCIDISAGLEYLSNNHYVHRDLATRNCLISLTYRVKIADFGLSQDIYSSDYFTLGDAELLPIRWMPPEAILYSKFTTQSDVWSFGVVLWEIFSFGIQPYYTLSNEAVVQHVRDGNILSCPENCPSEIYDLMVDCWVMNPNERPTASELHNGLRRWSPNFSTQIHGQEKPKCEYQNMGVVKEYAQQGLPETVNDTAMTTTTNTDSPFADTSKLAGDSYDHLRVLHEGTKPLGETTM